MKVLIELTMSICILAAIAMTIVVAHNANQDTIRTVIYE